MSETPHADRGPTESDPYSPPSAGPARSTPDTTIRVLTVALALLPLVAFGYRLLSGSGPDVDPAEAHDPLRPERRSLKQSLERRLDETGSSYLMAADEVYRERGYEPLWIARQGVQPRTEMMIRFLGRFRLASFPPHLDPRRLEKALRLMERYPISPEARDDLELRLTEAYLYCSERLLATMELDADELDWGIERSRYPEPLEVLRAAIEPGLTAAEVSGIFAGLSPPHPQADRLADAVTKYRRIVDRGGWPELALDTKLEPGQEMAPERWRTLVERLRIEGFLDHGFTGTQGTYGPELEHAVRRAQASRGLGVDGKLGPKTVAALDTPAQTRLAQLELNLVRARWLPYTPKGREVLVNLPAYRLWVLEQGEPIETMKVIVGKKSWPTPVFEDTIEYVVVNPAWNIPSAIAEDEILPRLRRAPDELIAEGFEIVVGYGEDTKRYELAGLDAEILAAADVDWRFRQRPGRANPLGRIKFIFPNEHSVYLHDTSTPAAFERAERALSHGCVRVAEPRKLARALMSPAEADFVLATLDRGVRDTRVLSQPTPVSIVYFTAWVDEDGTVGFYDDVYAHDRRLLESLTARQTAASDSLVTRVAQLGWRHQAVAVASLRRPGPGQG